MTKFKIGDVVEIKKLDWWDECGGVRLGSKCTITDIGVDPTIIRIRFDSGNAQHIGREYNMERKQLKLLYRKPEIKE